MAFRRRKLDQPQTTIPLDPLCGLQLLRRDRASAVHATGDRVPSHGRRILAQVGLNGNQAWHIPDDAPGGPTKIYPTRDVERVCVRTPPLTLTPGHFVRAHLVALPSGQTEAADPEDVTALYLATGPQGDVKISVTYDNGTDSVAVEKTISIPASAETDHAQPQGDAAAWANLHEFTTDLFRPANLGLVSSLAEWVDGVTVEIAVAYVGSPRVVDLVVYEEPLSLAYDLAAGDWIAPLHADGHGNALAQLAGPVPVVKRSASDPGGGAEIVCDAARRQCQELGPMIMYQSAWCESSQSVTSTETDPISVADIYASARDLIFTTNPMAWVASAVGWSIASGANARRVQDSETSRVLRDTTSVCAVRVWLYGSMSTTTNSPTAVVRFSSQLYSLAEVQIPSDTTYAWHSAPGHLETNLGAQDPLACVIHVHVSPVAGDASFRWRYACMSFDGSI